VATISRMLKNIGLFCKRALQKRPVFCKETCIFKHPTHRSHPISEMDKQTYIHICTPIYICIYKGAGIYRGMHTRAERNSNVYTYALSIYVHIKTIYTYFHICIGGGELEGHADEMKQTGVTGKDKRILSATNSAIQWTTHSSAEPKNNADTLCNDTWQHILLQHTLQHRETNHTDIYGALRIPSATHTATHFATDTPTQGDQSCRHNLKQHTPQHILLHTLQHRDTNHTDAHGALRGRLCFKYLFRDFFWSCVMPCAFKVCVAVCVTTYAAVCVTVLCCSA